MKKITRVLLAIMLLVNSSTFAQLKLSNDFTVTTGTPYQVVDANTKEYFSDGKYAYSVKVDGGKVTIQKFDVVAMKEIARNSYEDFPDNMKPQKVLQSGDKIFLVYCAINKKSKNEDLYAREVNKEAVSFKEAKLLLSTSSEIAISAYTENSSNIFNAIGIRYQVYSSFDGSRLLVNYRLKPINKKDSENSDILGFYVYDLSLSKLWGGEVKMPYTEEEMNNLAYAISKEGIAYMLAYVTKDKAFELFSIRSDLSLTKNPIEIPGNLCFQEFKLKESADGNLSCAGIYANGIDVIVEFYKYNRKAATGGPGYARTSFNANGIIYFKMNKSGKVLEKNDHEFPIGLITQYEKQRDQDKSEARELKGKAGIADLKLTNLDYKADGSLILIAEQQYVKNEYQGTTVKQVFTYGDIVATKIDAAGRLLWMKKLPKTQIGYAGRGGNGIRYIGGEKYDFVLYLDNISNYNINIDEAPKKHQDGKGGFLSAYKIDDASGSVSKAAILDLKNVNEIEAYQFKTSRIFSADDKTFLLEIYIKGKQDTMIKMELKK